MPSVWVPLYGSVSFSNMPYKKCIDNRAWQDMIMNRVFKAAGYAASAAGLYGVYHLYNTYKMFEESLN